MAERSSSTTALRVAQLRAVHQMFDGEPKILHDAVSVRLFGNEIRERLKAEAPKLNEPWVSGLRSHVLLRSRYAEDRLAEAYQRGVRQYVLLGAGYDTFAYRQPAWARDLRIFEVDHPASQREKQDRLRGAGVEIPANLEFVSIDFEHVSLLDGLAASGLLRFDQPAFFACLGVLVYLTREAADAVFRCVASFPASSEIVFTYSAPTSKLSPEDAARRAAIGAITESMGEPWQTFFEPEVLIQKLEGLGFELTFLKASEAEVKYFQGRTDGLQVPKREPVVRALVGRK